MRAAFVAPLYYKGTSFERICTSIKSCIESQSMDLDYIVLSEVPNNLNPSNFDDKEFFKYQLELLKQLMEVLPKYDRILFLDFFNPGIDLLQYYADQMNIKTKFYSLLHGGTFLEDDLLQASWITQYEKSWSELYEKVYVPSKFAQSMLPDFLRRKSVNLPWGLDAIWSELKPSAVKDIDVVFPHRISDDKGVKDLCILSKLCPDSRFVITSPSGIIPDSHIYIKDHKNIEVIVCRDNSAYYKCIGRAKIVLSCAFQELYGYSVAESVASGAYPVLPNRQVYPEYYDSTYLYSTNEEAALMINRYLKNPQKINEGQLMKQHSFISILEDFIT